MQLVQTVGQGHETVNFGKFGVLRSQTSRSFEAKICQKITFDNISQELSDECLLNLAASGRHISQ